MDQQLAMVVRSSGPEVMVSYSSKDRARVLQLVQRLRSAGVAVWIDHGGIDGAQRWSEEIVNAIDACKTVVLMVSQSSAQSDNIAKEVALAWENGKHFLPLYLEEAKIPKSMQYQLAGIQHIRLFDGDPEARFISVLRSLARLDVHISAYASALVSADSGEKDQAFEWLNRACEQRSASLAKLTTEPRFATLRNDPRYSEIVKRVESLTLEPEESVSDSPVLLPRTLTKPGSTGPVPLWKRILWPDIFDDRSARQATAQGVWACAFIVAATILASILTSTAGKVAVLGLGWNEPIVVALIFGPIAFGIFKMGRPAAIIGLVLCSIGAFGNLGVLRASGAAVDAYNQVPEQYRNQYGYDPYSAYYRAWFSLAISVACVAAFTNATRGSFAYRELVSSGRARDKQDAINREEWIAIKSGTSAKFQSLMARAKRRDVATSGPQAVSMPKEVPVPRPIVVAEPQPAPVPVVSNLVTMPPARILPPRSSQSFAALVGIQASSISWPKAGAFLLANLFGALSYFGALAATSALDVSGAYWLLALAQACVFSIAAVMAFRFIRNPWTAAALAAFVTLLLTLPLYGGLPGFQWADLFYREQFQQFVLLPLVSGFVFLAALALLVPKLQPCVLALWLSAMSADIVSALFAALLRGLGAKEGPDPVLGSASLIAAICRSLVFAAVWWGLLLYMGRKSEVPSKAAA